MKTCKICRGVYRGTTCGCTINTSQNCFSQLSETVPELVVDRDGKSMPCPIFDDNTGISGCTHIPIGYTNEDFARWMELNNDRTLVFPELKFKNGEFEK